MLRRVTELPRPTPATLGYRPTSAETGGGSRNPAAGGPGHGQRLRRIPPFYRRWFKPRPNEKIGEAELTIIAAFIAIICLVLFALLHTT